MSENHSDSVSVLRLFRFWNDILLIPMFVFIMLRFSGDFHELYDPAYLFFCASFSLEWLWAMFVAENKRAFLKNPLNIIDLISAIPFALITGVKVAQLHEIVRIVRIFARVSRWSKQAQQASKVVGVVLVTVLTGAIGLQMIEPETVPTFGDALWWSVVTISTVGYGDFVPVTGAGRLLASLLVVVGFGVFGYVAGYVADLMRNADDRTSVLLHRIDDRLARLEERMTRSDEDPDKKEES